MVDFEPVVLKLLLNRADILGSDELSSTMPAMASERSLSVDLDNFDMPFTGRLNAPFTGLVQTLYIDHTHIQKYFFIKAYIFYLLIVDFIYLGLLRQAAGGANTPFWYSGFDILYLYHDRTSVL